MLIVGLFQLLVALLGFAEGLLDFRQHLNVRMGVAERYLFFLLHNVVCCGAGRLNAGEVICQLGEVGGLEEHLLREACPVLAYLVLLMGIGGANKLLGSFLAQDADGIVGLDFHVVTYCRQLLFSNADCFPILSNDLKPSARALSVDFALDGDVTPVDLWLVGITSAIPELQSHCC